MTAKPQFLPLYMQVKDALLSRIISGEWAPGAFLPSEYMLAQDYGVSQGTLRKALNSLTDEKVLVRYQGKGTAVAFVDESSTLFPFFLLADRKGNRVYPTSHNYAVKLEDPSQEIISALSLSSSEDLSSKVICIYRIREIEGNPVINEVVMLPQTRFKNFPIEVESIPNTLYKHYQLRYGITVSRVSEIISAVAASENEVRLLKVAKKMPILEVKRVSYDLAGMPIEYRISRINTLNYVYHGAPR